ncbi:MAG: hypothetical protein ACRD8Z_03785 [Nitrososphaeraceae archaeon]
MGKNDIFFGPQGVLTYDLKDIGVHQLNAGPFPIGRGFGCQW